MSSKAVVYKVKVRGQEAGLGRRGPQRAIGGHGSALNGAYHDGTWEITLARMQTWVQRQE